MKLKDLQDVLEFDYEIIIEEVNSKEKFNFMEIFNHICTEEEFYSRLAKYRNAEILTIDMRNQIIILADKENKNEE